VRANARTLPEGTNRRALLGAVFVAGAAASLPAVAAASIASSRHPDSDLLALIKRAKIAESIADDACEDADDILQKTLPSFPEALIWNEGDGPHWCGIRRGDNISNEDIDWLRSWLAMPRKPDLTGKGVPLIFPAPAFVERALEIVKTKDEYDAAYQAAEKHPDVIDAEDRSEALKGQWEELAERVAKTPAKTPEGLIAKILMVAAGYSEDDLDGSDDGILASVVLDAEALMKRAEAQS
jgi:hypothetical protein